MPAPIFATGDVPSASQVNDWMVNVSAARKTSTQSVAGSTVLVNDSQLVVTVAANAVYELTGLLVYDGDAAGDLKLGWTAPAGAAMNWTAMGLHVLATGYNDDQVPAFDLATASPSLGAIGAGTTCAGRLAGLLVTAGTAGTLQLQWAQRTAFATATRLFTNSYLSLRRLS